MNPYIGHPHQLYGACFRYTTLPDWHSPFVPTAVRISTGSPTRESISAISLPADTLGRSIMTTEEKVS